MKSAELYERDFYEWTVAETGLPAESFPSTCPFEFAALLDEQFLP